MSFASILTSVYRVLLNGIGRRPYVTLEIKKTSLESITIKTDIGSPSVSLEYDTGIETKQKTFWSTWLVHNCCCPNCKQVYSGQKLIEVSKLLPIYKLRKLIFDEKNNQLQLTWEEIFEHTTIIPLELLLPSKEEIRNAVTTTVFPDKFINIQTEIPNVEFSKLSSENETFYLMKMINEYGACIVNNSPCDKASLVSLASKMGPVQPTIYGELWDVETQEKPINIAYSDAKLNFHMDLVYYESPPGIQLLHCLEFDGPEVMEGGESTLADAWKVASLMQDSHPKHFSTLTKIPATFKKIHSHRTDPVHMVYKRPHVVVDSKGMVIGVNWSPPFEGALDVYDSEVCEQYYSAYITFAQMLESSLFRKEFRLRPGDILCFNNRRIVHGRKAMKQRGGRRHLRGCYVNIDEFKNKLQTMANRFEPDYSVRHVCNGSYT